MKTAIIVAWRKGETDLDATIKSAGQSAGDETKIYAVEDTDRQGPGRTRHKGIMAASESCDVAIIIDPHMRFRGDVLSRLAHDARHTGLLVCPSCWHNDKCSWDAPGQYHGGRLVWKTDDAGISPPHSALAFKWATGPREPGLITCVGGACYGFRIDWYIGAGCPLAALPGWGGDEEALSISAWRSNAGPYLIEGDVAHRYRAAAPWKLTGEELQAIRDSRRVLVQCAVEDPDDRAALLGWIGAKPRKLTREASAWRDALRSMPRDYADWRANGCEGYGAPDAQQKIIPAACKPRANYGATETLRLCTNPKCNSDKSTVVRTRQVGALTFRYRICLMCGRRRVTRQVGNQA